MVIGGLLALLGAPIVVDAPPPLIVATASPRGVAPVLASAELLRLVEAAVPDTRPLAVTTADRVGLDVDALLECPLERRLACWTERAARAHPDALLLVLSVVGGPRGATYTGVLLDVRTERERVASLAGRTTEQIENALFEHTISFDRSDVPRARLVSALREDVTRSVATVFDRRADLAPWGELELTTAPGWTVSVDDREVGVTEAVTSMRLRPGTRKVAVRDPVDADRIEREVDVTSASVVRLDLRVVPNHPMHAVSAWSGVGVGGLGAIVLVAAAAAGAEPTYQLYGPREQRYATTCDLFSSDCQGRGLALLPLGAALFVAGGAVAASYFGLADGGEYEWWWAAIGVALGAVTYGVVAAVE